jgi:hypothetical protein
MSFLVSPHLSFVCWFFRSLEIAVKGDDLGWHYSVSAPRQSRFAPAIDVFTIANF